MATKVFHGAPGSYKSSTAMWFEVVPALRSGRVVVTNLQGIKNLEDIQRELKEEIGIEVLACQPLLKIPHDYGDKKVLLDV